MEKHEFDYLIGTIEENKLLKQQLAVRANAEADCKALKAENETLTSYKELCEMLFSKSVNLGDADSPYISLMLCSCEGAPKAIGIARKLGLLKDKE